MFIIISLLVVVSFLLVLIILAQNSKGGGLSSQFGGSGASNLIGVKKTGDLLENITWVLAISLLVLSLSTNFFMTDVNPNSLNSPNIDRANEQVVPPNFDAGEAPATTDPSQDGSLEGLTEDSEQ